jgi:selenocysteine-specific elongation factor
MRIVGTAGHVDHGKSALVVSLTGHNPDRWAQERERGMTLDLGFAPLRYADGMEAGIIDVPGHARFLHNMLAGAAGMDLLLLVIDAVEGPRPQTREHLHILNFLNVRRAIVVLTKADLVDAEAIEIASALARDVCIGTVAWGAPILSVSNVTGAGIEELKATIHDVLIELPPHRTDAPAYLPIDRVFALPGHGTIVTGTLMQGTLSVGAATFGHRYARAESANIRAQGR